VAFCGAAGRPAADCDLPGAANRTIARYLAGPPATTQLNPGWPTSGAEVRSPAAGQAFRIRPALQPGDTVALHAFAAAVTAATAAGCAAHCAGLDPGNGPGLEARWVRAGQCGPVNVTAGEAAGWRPGVCTCSMLQVTPPPNRRVPRAQEDGTRRRPARAGARRPACAQVWRRG
jgi:hypothetical protein